MKVQQGVWRGGSKTAAFFLEGFFPSCVRGQARGAVEMVLVVVVNLALEELIGLVDIPDFFKPQERHQALLEGAEEPFDFALGLGRRSHAMVDSQGAQGSLELGHGVQTVVSRSVAKEAQAIGIEASRAAEAQESRPQKAEVTPGGVGVKAPGHNLARVVIGRQNEGLQR